MQTNIIKLTYRSLSIVDFCKIWSKLRYSSMVWIGRISGCFEFLLGNLWSMLIISETCLFNSFIFETIHVLNSKCLECYYRFPIFFSISFNNHIIYFSKSFNNHISFISQNPLIITYHLYKYTSVVRVVVTTLSFCDTRV